MADHGHRTLKTRRNKRKPMTDAEFAAAKDKAEKKFGKLKEDKSQRIEKFITFVDSRKKKKLKRPTGDRVSQRPR